MPIPHTTFFIVWTAAVLSLLAVLVYSSLQSRASKLATVRFGKQLQQNPELGPAFAQTLYRPVAWIDLESELSSKNWPTLLASLPNRVGNFLIRYSQWVSEDSFLVITTVDYFRPYTSGHEFFTPVNRGTRETYNLNFVIRFDAHNNQIVIFSDLYTTLVDKNLRADFAQAFFALLPR